MAQTLQLVTVRFHDDEIQAGQDHTGAIWVPLRRPCEALGLDYSAQFRRLKRQPWARTVMMAIPDLRGSNQETACLHLDSLPMWLATLTASRIRAELRPKLERYQLECARVLRDHFLGGPGIRPWSLRLDEYLVSFRREVNTRHPGWWAVATELMADMLVLEDELVKHGFPLSVSDLPDGSVGSRYRDHRTANHVILPFKEDCPLTTPRGITVYPRVYQPEEVGYFRRWFTTRYVPDHMPDYLTRKASRDRVRWLAHNQPIPPRRQVIAAADSTSRRISGRSLAALGYRQQLDQAELF